MSSTTHNVCDFCGFDSTTLGKRLREFQSLRIDSAYQDVCSTCWERMVHALKNKPGAPTAEETREAVQAATEPLQAEIDRLRDLFAASDRECARLRADLAEETRQFREAIASDTDDHREFDERLQRLIVNLAAGCDEQYDINADPFVTLETLATELLRRYLSTSGRVKDLDFALAEERKQHSHACKARDEVLRLATVLAGMIGKKSRARNSERIAEVERQLTILTGRTS